MIESISIRNLGVIAQAELSLAPGFNALTGETGAGKTMVLSALNLLLGGRADTAVIRAGEDSLSVSGTWVIRNPLLKEELENLGAQLDGGELIITRTVNSDGRSRAILGGTPVPISTLSELAERLVAVHGQSDQQRLRSVSAQRDALDDYGKLNAHLDAYRQAHTTYQELQARYERMKSASGQDRARVEELTALLSTFERLSPVKGEIAELGHQIERLSNVDNLRIAASTAHEAISPEDSVGALQALGIARKSLDSTSDPKLQEIASQLSDLTSLARDISVELSSYLLDLEIDPQQLEANLERRAELVAFERRNGELDAFIDGVPKLQAELLDLDSSDEQLEKLEVQLEASLSQLAAAAKSLSEARREAAQRLGHEVTTELAELAMVGSRLVVQVTDLGEFEASGSDRVEFMLAAFDGANLRPISKAASGGELSRIMLALELVLAKDKTLPTMIFDEVDAGVGGQTASELGRRLARVAANTQVLVITHLAQVAAFASNQIRVLKNTQGSITHSSVLPLSGEERVRELARMLSGAPDSDVAIAHAKELLASS
ncbi:MAG: repair protein RecN [Actinomycetota bacterium]